MLRRFYLITGLVTALGVGLIVASGDTGQKEKDKDKAKTEKQEKEKEKPWVAQSEPALEALTLAHAFGEGGYLGVFLEDVTSERMKELGLSEERGAIIMKVVEGSPAAKAGLKENDVVVSYNGERIDSVRELQRLLNETPADRSVTIEVVRGGSRQTVTATLSNRSGNFTLLRPEFDDKFWKQNEEAMKRAQEESKKAQELFKQHQDQQKLWQHDFGNFAFVAPGEFTFFRGKRLGIGVESLTPQLAEFFGVKDAQGVLVTEVDANSAAAKGGLKAGDVIVAFDNEKIDNVRALMTAISKKQEGQATIKIVRNRSEQTVTVTFEKPAPPPAPRAPRVKVSARDAAL